LFGLDVNIRARVSKCSTGSLEIYIGCKGTDCTYLKNYKLCESDSECSQTTKCNRIQDHSYVPYSVNPLYYGLFKNVSQVCYAYDTTRDLRNILYSLQGGVKDYTGTSTSGICFIDKVILDNLNISKWASDQIQVDGNSFTLKELLAWDVGGNPLDTEKNKNYAIHLAISLFTLIFAWLV